MKTKRVCPKCNSTDILMVPGKAGAYGVGSLANFEPIGRCKIPLN